MKKFLSLVLALVMTMSLVTVSAGAAEYDELTDKDEIQYEEAVTVLNRLGIITGYTDGSFQPKTELTRGAAAKIIVSLLIGPEAASNLVAASAPYTDVPVDHTFAGVISYCKTAGIINGYSDGSFKPLGTLSGYAFSKMLLGAIGYKGEIEGFSGAGWTMNVARLGNSANLFNRISFKGNEAVNREEACQLALNTLKATMVEYTGGMTITSGDATIVGGQTRTYITSNQEYARHILNRKLNSEGNALDDHYTVEFGEEHFKDLRLDADGKELDDFGRPSSVWSYKKVTIGTFPLEPDFTFTSQLAIADDATDAAKNRATGLGGYKIDKEGVNAESDYEDTTAIFVNGVENSNLTAKQQVTVEKPAQIADLTDNGTVVEVYIDQDVADAISHIVVIKTQLMEVKRVGSDYVSLQLYDNKGLEGKNDNLAGFNQNPLDEKVINVEDGDDYFTFLSGLKADDIVAVVPVGTNHDDTEWTVGDVYVPETVSGALTAANTYGKTGDLSGDRTTVGVTVGGTEYKTALWNKDLKDINNDKIAVTRKDVTLYLDRNGYAMLAKDVGDSDDYVVLSYYYQSLVNGRIVDFAHVFDLSGNVVELNLGQNGADYRIAPGDLAYYKANTTSNTADWDISGVEAGGNKIYKVNSTYNATEYSIKKSHTRIPLLGTDTAANYGDSGIKFVYVNFNEDYSEVDSIQIVKGFQNVDYEELIDKSPASNADAAEAYINSDGAVKAVVIKNTTGTLSSNVLYVQNKTGREEVLNGKKYYQYQAAVVNGSDFNTNVTIWSDTSLRNGDFATWSEGTVEGLSGTFYNTRKLAVQGKTTSAVWADVVRVDEVGSGTIRVTGYKMDGDDVTPNIRLDDGDKSSLTVGNSKDLIRMGNAHWVYQGPARCPLPSHNEAIEIETVKELDDFLRHCGYLAASDDGGPADPSYTVSLRFVYNDNTESDDFREVALVVVTALPTWASSPAKDWIAPADPQIYDFVVDPTPDDQDEMDGASIELGRPQYPEVSDPADPAVILPVSEKVYGSVADPANDGVDVYYTAKGRAVAPSPIQCTTENQRLEVVTAPADTVDPVAAVKDASVTDAASYATAIAARDLYVYTGTGTAASDADATHWTKIDKTDVETTREAVTFTGASAQTDLDTAAAGGKLYATETGTTALPTDAYVAGDYVAKNVDATAADFNQAAWDALIEDGLWTADPGDGEYTTTGKVAAGTAMPSGATNAYFTYTPAEGTKVDTTATYYLEKTVNKTAYVADTDYYTSIPTAGTPAVPGAWKIKIAAQDLPEDGIIITKVLPHPAA